MSGQTLIELAKDHLLSLTEETHYSPRGIVSRIVFSKPGTGVVLFGFAAGQELTEHTSNSDILIQILSGECDFTVNGNVHSLKAGDFLHIPPCTVHAVKATQRFSMLLTLSRPFHSLAPNPGKSPAKLEKPLRDFSINVK